MKKFIVSAVWLIISVPYYAFVLLCTAWSVLVIKNLGRLFRRLLNNREPYKWIDKVDEYIYNIVKDELLS